MNFKKIFFYFSLVIFTQLGFPPTGFSQSTFPSHEALVDKIINKIPLKEQLGEAPADIRTQFGQNPFQLPEERNKAMLQLFDEAYEPTLLMDDFKTSLVDSMSDQYDEEIHQWLNKSSTESVYAAQQEFYTLQGKRKQVITLYEMDQKPVSDKRKKLITNFTDTTSIENASIESSVIILRSVIEAVEQISATRNFSKSKINAIVDNFRSQMKGQANQQLNTQLLVMYHDVSFDELKDFTSFWSTDAGQWLDEHITQSMEATYKSAADRFLESVIDYTPQ